jgi:hypothetical protein
MPISVKDKVDVVNIRHTSKLGVYDTSKVSNELTSRIESRLLNNVWNGVALSVTFAIYPNAFTSAHT